MAIYDPNFSPLKDLQARRRADKKRKQRLAPREVPGSVLNAGSAFAIKGNKAAATAMRNRAERDWQQDEDKRLSGVQSQLYKEDADRSESALGRVGDFAKQEMVGSQQLERQEMVGGQQLGLEAARSKSALNLDERRGKRALGLETMRQLGKSGKQKKTGLPSMKDRFSMRGNLRKEFYGKDPTGKGLRKKYGDKGFELFFREQEKFYQPAPEQAARPNVNQPPNNPVFRDPVTGVWTNRGAPALPQMSGQDVESYVAGAAGQQGATGQQVNGVLPRIQADPYRKNPSLSEFVQPRLAEKERFLADAFRPPPRFAGGSDLPEQTRDPFMEKRRALLGNINRYRQ
jgi:hypothetical protein